MVRFKVKKGDEDPFLWETTLDTPVQQLVMDIVQVYNGRLKVKRVADELFQLAAHGVSMSPNMQGLTGRPGIGFKTARLVS